jgi:glycosyltransferase involved in cell wall biosynthesis
MPRVSIIAPVYNKQEFLRESVTSILSQEFSDFELIIIDDCSTDSSREIISSLEDPRVRKHFNLRNQGQAETLNKGIDLAQGEFICFAHGDDVWNSDFLSRHVAMLEKYPQINFSHARAEVIDDAGRTLSLDPSVGPERVTSSLDTVRRLVKGSHVMTPTAFLRRGTFPYFNYRYFFPCDWDLWLRIAAEGNNFLFIDRPLIKYRVSPQNVTSVSARTGLSVMEDYLVLTQFFARYPQFNMLRGEAFRRMAMRTMRLTKSLPDRKTIFLYHRLALVISPVSVLNPLFLPYVILGLLFGSKGMIAFRSATGSLRKIFTGSKRAMACQPDQMGNSTG